MTTTTAIRRLAMLATAFATLQYACFAAMIPVTAGPLKGVDDDNTSTLNPQPPIFVSTLLNSQCPWINTGLDAFKATHAGWDYNWAPKADMQKVELGLSILDYFAFVVKRPAVKAGDGTTYPAGPGPNDLGGAVFNLKYAPVAGAPAFTELHWIQAYSETTKGVSKTVLDNPFSPDSPFYDTAGAAGTLPGGGAWFLDRPFDSEGEYEGHPVSTVQFQVVLADYDSANKKIKLYGGEWWGYSYDATDTPEPATAAFYGIGVWVIIIARRRVAGRRLH